MLSVSLLLQHASEVPGHDEWLSPSEQQVLAKYWAPKRRRDWRLGRWTGKVALLKAGMLGDATRPDDASLARITIHANEAGAPAVLVDGQPSGWLVSLSHTGEHGLAAVARQPASIGCDMETIGRRGQEFVLDYFTPPERASVDRFAGDERSRMVTVVWSAKESALKALGIGLLLDTREVQVEASTSPAAPGAWSPLLVRVPERRFAGWWRSDEERVITMVSDPAPRVPITGLI